MINDKGILIKNIYYMLTYAFQILKEKDIVQIESESFQDIQDLFAEIITKGMSAQLKQGLYKQYIAYDENLLKVRGKINIPETIKNQMQKRELVHCEYDELSESSTYDDNVVTGYGFKLKKQEFEQFKLWDKLYPPNFKECQRNLLVTKYQGNDNPFVTRKCR